jgi:hypothetical protein
VILIKRALFSTVIVDQCCGFGVSGYQILDVNFTEWGPANMMKFLFVGFLLILSGTAFTSAFAQDDLPAPPDEETPVNQETAVSGTISLDASTVRRILAESDRQTPYEVTCAPVVLMTELKDKYNAFNVGVFPSKANDAPQAVPGKTIVMAMNATMTDAATQAYQKSFLKSVVGSGLNAVMNAAPAMLTVAFGSKPRVFDPAVLTLLNASIPSLGNGVSRYGTSRNCRREAIYHDGIFRGFEEHLQKMTADADSNRRSKKGNAKNFANPTIPVYFQLPLYSSMIINKESNSGKPIVQITNAAGQSWVYYLNCDQRDEIGL